MKQVCHGILVAGLTLAGLQAAPQAESASAGEPRGKIGGIVISAKTGEALRGARVTLQPNGRGMRRASRAQTTTDLNGRFLLTEVAAGRYTILAEKTAYETRRGTRIGNINLAQDQSRSDLVIQLRPAAVITGRVLDSYGEVVAGATVAALRRHYAPGQQGLQPEQAARTDDLGEYRLYGLAMGKYIIGVNPPQEPAPKGAFIYEQLPAYYPGTTNSDEAAVLKVTWGTELLGIDFRLAPAPATAVSGFVADGATGEELYAHLSVTTEQGARLGSFTSTEDGRFALYGLPATKLFVAAFSRKGGSFAFARAEIYPTESRLEEVEILIQPLVTVSGKVVLVDPPEDSEQPQVEGSEGAQRPPMLSLRGLSKVQAGRSHRASIPVNGGPFEMEDVQPGEYRLQADAPEGSYLKALARSGRKIQGLTLTVPPDAAITDLELHFAFDGASASGTVVLLDSDSEAGLDGARIAIIPDDPDQNTGPTSASVADDNSFEILDMPPGGYTLFAVSARSALDLWDPAVRQALRASGKHLQLDPKEQVTVELTSIEEPDEPL